MEQLSHNYPDLLTVKEVSERIPLPKTTIHDMARRGDIPGVVYLGRRVLFNKRKLFEFLDGGGTERSN